MNTCKFLRVAFPELAKYLKEYRQHITLERFTKLESDNATVLFQHRIVLNFIYQSSPPSKQELIRNFVRAHRNSNKNINLRDVQGPTYANGKDQYPFRVTTYHRPLLRPYFDYCTKDIDNLDFMQHPYTEGLSRDRNRWGHGRHPLGIVIMTSCGLSFKESMQIHMTQRDGPHVLIDRKGNLHGLVPMNKIAWHTNSKLALTPKGGKEKDDEVDFWGNAHGIGIMVVDGTDSGQDGSKFHPKQNEQLWSLVDEILKKFKTVKKENIFYQNEFNNREKKYPAVCDKLSDPDAILDRKSGTTFLK
eukprot:CAMPEP_0185269964 /NCGR_PEP_ID=MMETSP1359-20130426/41176_1 /TAXON_ID=552665 /ORGANISM="Bigelowiella longifila, Strain CCMP242" /LENGTH=302 /DNA_ID=CAMNT_0027861359 /DNA_START=40 /DNA_END=948 /DNA_ORIENTATION=+